MTTISPSPRRVRSPSWFDLRLIAGAVLVLGSVVAGVAVVSSADRTQRMWAVTHDVGAGVVLTSADVKAVPVRLQLGAGVYYPVGTGVTGQTVTRPLSAGELLPRSALGTTVASTTVTIPLSADDAPKIRPGDRITVWVSTKACPAATVLADTAVQDVQTTHAGNFGATGGEDVIVRLGHDDAERVIQALALNGAVIRAGVLTGPSSSTSEVPVLGDCGDSGS